MAELYFADFRFDTRVLRLAGPDGEIEIRPKTLELLTYLIENRNRFIPRQELMEVLWPDVVVTPSSLTQCVSELRQALGDSTKEPEFIETRIKKGYRFKAMVYHQPTRRIEDIPPPPEIAGDEKTVESRRGRVLVFAGISALAATLLVGSWFLHRQPTRPLPVSVRMLVADDSGMKAAGEELRQAILEELSRLPGVDLEASEADFRDGFDIEISCSGVGADAEILTILRDRKSGETVWGWNWIPGAQGEKSSRKTIEAVAGGIRTVLVRRLPASSADD